MTVTTVEVLSSEIQRDIHYTLRMEHHTDYVFKDEEASQYSATISMENTNEVISKIIECSSNILDYTIMLEEVDMQANHIVKYLLEKYENRLKDAPEGMAFKQLYNQEKMEPVQEYQELYEQVKEELRGIGLPFNSTEK